MADDYYGILEIDRDASQAEVKKAYRRLARKYHPDANPDDPSAADKFRLLKEAFDILSDPLERDKYDHQGPGGDDFDNDYDMNNQSQASSYGTPPPPSRPSNGYYSNADQYNQPPSTPDPRPPTPHHQDTIGMQAGADLKYDLEITFEESIYGLETELEVPIMAECNVCQGIGIRPGAPQVPCAVCNGMGEVSQNMYGRGGRNLICDTCQGTGISPEYLCMNCQGNGRVRSVRNVYVKVPPGVENGARLRIRNMGEPGIRGGPAGDLYVMIYILEHDIFERHGNEILCEATISLLQASLGAEIEVPTIEGKAVIKIPPGTQTGTIFRLRGKGVPDVRTKERGDQHVKITVITPTNLNKNAKNLLWKFGKEIGEDMDSILMRRGKSKPARKR